MSYVKPVEGVAVPLVITKSALVTKNLTVLKGGSLQQADIPCFEIELQHLSSAYGQRTEPYKLTMPVHLTWTALDNPPKIGPGLPAYPNKQGARLLWAAGLIKDADGPLPDDIQAAADALLGAHVMTLIQHTQDGEDYAHSWMYWMPETDISLKLLDGTKTKAKITYETVHVLWLLQKPHSEAIVEAVTEGADATVQAHCVKGKWQQLAA